MGIAGVSSGCAKRCKDALHSTHISFGTNEVYDHRKHLKGGHTLMHRFHPHLHKFNMSVSIVSQ